MPIYEYRCEKCGDEFEVIQKFSDDPLVIHDGCGGSLTKLISQSSFQLKGSGWYVTDYARKSAPAESSSGEKKDSPEDKGSTETKAPSKASSETKSGEA